MSIRTALILAAGRGRRISSLIQDRPKCLIEVGGETVLARALRSLRQNDLEEIWVATGYRSDAIDKVHSRTLFNAHFQTDNVVGTFYESRPVWMSGAICCFADILFLPEVVHDLLQSSTPVAIANDPFWRDRHQDRIHDMANAEFVCAVNGNVTKMIKGPLAHDCVGEALGIFKIDTTAAEVVGSLLDNHIQNNPGIRTKSMLYLFNLLVDEGIEIGVVDCHTPWHELDTPEDLERTPSEFLQPNPQTLSPGPSQ